MEILNSDFEVDDQLVYMKSKDVTSVLFIRYNLRCYQVSSVPFHSYPLFSSCSEGPLLPSRETRKALWKLCVYYYWRQEREVTFHKGNCKQIDLWMKQLSGHQTLLKIFPWYGETQLFNQSTWLLPETRLRHCSPTPPVTLQKKSLINLLFLLCSTTLLPKQRPLVMKESETKRCLSIQADYWTATRDIFCYISMVFTHVLPC